MKKVWIFRVGVILLLLLLSTCSGEEPTVNEQMATCDDGILNGEEITVDCGGTCPGFCPLESIGILEGELVSILTLDRTVEYTLRGPFLVRDKAQLNIPEGTVIKADPGSYIAIAQGGKIQAFGQPYDPVIITSSAENPAPGDWGGLVICGKAPIQSGDVGRTEIIDIFYGGADVEDTSGVLRNIRIEYAGGMVDDNKTFDGIAFYGVGAITTINGVQVYASKGNGVRFIGGTPKVNNLVVNNSGASSIVLQNDWNGNGNNWYLRDATFSGIEITSNNDNFAVSAAITGTINNASIVGDTFNQAISFSGGGKYIIEEVYTSNMNVGIQIDNSTITSEIESRDLLIENIEFDSPATDFILTNYTGTFPFFTENQSLGAGNKGLAPDWAQQWTIDLN